MKYSLVIAILIFNTNLMFSQNLDKFEFVNASILNIRSEPTIESKVVGKAKKNSTIKVISKVNNYEEINGIKNKWKKIQYGEIEGFVFGGYLSENSFSHNQTDTFDIVLDMYYHLDYNPNLNWYGVY